MTTTNKQELAYCFSFSVSSDYGLHWDNSGGTGPATMQDYVTTVAKAFLADAIIQGVIGSDWVPVWGPVVQAGYSGDQASPTVHADATMGCYYSPSNNLFTIPIAGTNINSPFDVTLDFDVTTMQPWSGIDPSGAGKGNIAAGTYEGVQTLLAMTNSEGITMLEALKTYITTNNVTGATIAVAGHSLGGALSPCIALYMFNNLATLGLSGQQIAAYPTAGPTPGDSEFAANFGAWLVSLYNTIDVVPLAWAEGDLATIPTLYGTNIPTTDSPANEFGGIIACGLQLNALASTGIVPSNPYTALPRNPLTGQYSNEPATALPHYSYGLWTLPLSNQATLIWNMLLPAALQTYESSLVATVLFAVQGVYQHIGVYGALIDQKIDPVNKGIETVVAEFKTIVAANKPTTAVTVDGVRHAVKRVTGVDLAAINVAEIAKAAAANQSPE